MRAGCRAEKIHKQASKTENKRVKQALSLHGNGVSSPEANVVLQSTPLDLTETGKGLKFQAERPHLVSLGSGRLSVAITLLPLPEGEVCYLQSNV